MRDITKKRIISIVKNYRLLFPTQYRLAAEANRVRSESQKTGWGEVLDSSSVLQREELRMPTDLHTILYTKLLPEEQAEFESDKGILWFQRTYPEWVPNVNKE